MVQLDFKKGPFAFDSTGALRCTKCNSPGWKIRGQIPDAIGVDWKTKVGTDPGSSKLSLPRGWRTTGTVKAIRDGRKWETLFRENWSHARHVELQRLGYATIYGGALLAALISSFVIRELTDLVKSGILGALAVYTGFQLLISEKLSQEFKHHVDHISLLVIQAPNSARQSWASMGLPMGGMRVFGRWMEVRLSRLGPVLYSLLLIVYSVGALYFLLLYLGIEPFGLLR